MAFPFDPSASTLWVLSREETISSCEVRFVPGGVQIEVTRNRKLLWSRIFEAGDQALREAEEEKQRMVNDGWE